MSQEAAFRRTLENEGGLNATTSELHDDPGGLTKWGISSKYYPNEDIKNMPISRALQIYSDIWKRERMDELPDTIAGKIFDMSFPMGWLNAVTCVQGALNACGQPLKIDGVMGVETLKALDTTFEDEFLAAFRSECASHFRLRATLKPYTLGHLLPGLLHRAYQQ